MVICVKCVQENLVTGVLEMGYAKMAYLGVEDVNVMKVSMVQPVKHVNQGDMEQAVNQVTSF